HNGCFPSWQVLLRTSPSRYIVKLSQQNVFEGRCETVKGSAFAMGHPWKGAFAAMGGGHYHHWGGGPRGRRGRHAFGPWMMFGGPWAGREQWGPPWFGPRGPRARRGDVRAAILGVLAERPANGYQIIQEITERSGGVWRPSPGSIYPTLQQLED